MKLNDYLKENHISQRDFGYLVGVTQGMVSHVINGVAKPTAKNTLAWCQATGWAVTPHDIDPDTYPNPTDALPPKHKNTQHGGENLTYAVQP